MLEADTLAERRTTFQLWMETVRDKAKESVNSSSSIERRLPVTRSLPYQKDDGRSLSDANTTVVTVTVVEFHGQNFPAETSASSSS